MSDMTLSFETGVGSEFGDILSNRPNVSEKLKAGLLACAYFEYWRMFSPEFKRNVIADLERIAKRLEKDVDLVYTGVVDTLDSADQAGRAFAEAGIEMLIVVDGTYVPDYMAIQAIDYVPHVPVVMFTTQVEENITPNDDYEYLMRNSAMIGTAQLSATFTKMGRKYDVVVGSLAEERPFEEIAGIARVYLVAARLKKLNIGVVGHVFRGMYDLENDRTRVRGFLGPNVITVELAHLLQQWEEVRDEETRAVAKALAQRFRQHGPKEEDWHRSVRLAIAMERLVERLRLDSLCVLGQHHIEKATGAPARLGACMMLEKGKHLVGSEGDIIGLTMMHILQWLTGNPPLAAEWGQYDAAHNALLLVGHGMASPALAGSDSHITLTGAPEEWGFQGAGINMQFIMSPGIVTMGHLLDTPNGWQMLISGGEALDYPCLPCQEIHALVKIERPVKEYLVELQRRGVTHHVVVAHGDVRRELQKLASVLQIGSFVL
jgi:L-arabinose isomerase